MAAGLLEHQVPRLAPGLQLHHRRSIGLVAIRPRRDRVGCRFGQPVAPQHLGQLVVIGHLVNQPGGARLSRRQRRAVNEFAQRRLGQPAPGGHAGRQHVVLVIQQPVELGAILRRHGLLAEAVEGRLVGRNLYHVGLYADAGQGVLEECHLGVETQHVELRPRRSNNARGGRGGVVVGQIEVGGVDDGVLARRPQPGHGGAEVLERGQPGAEAAEDEDDAARVVGISDHAQPGVQILQAERIGRQRQPALNEATRRPGSFRQRPADGQHDVIHVRPAQAAHHVAPVGPNRCEVVGERLPRPAEVAAQSLSELG